VLFFSVILGNTYAILFLVYAGFLLREVKDFWRVALLIALLAYPSPIGCSEDAMFKHTELDNRKKVFQAVENAILKLGMSSGPSFLTKVHPCVVDCSRIYALTPPCTIGIYEKRHPENLSLHVYFLHEFNFKEFLWTLLEV